MAVLTVNNISRSGLVQSLAAVNNSDSFPNDGRCFLHVKNGSGGSINVTITTTKTVDGKAVADDVIAVANSAEALIGPFPPSIYNDANDRVGVAYSATSSVTAAVMRLP